MAYTSRVLVISRQTADSDDLVDALRQRAERGPIKITLLIPAPDTGTKGRELGKAMLESALTKLRGGGLEAEGLVGDPDPIGAVMETWAPGRFDEIFVATLPGASSAWLRFDFPHRVATLCDCPVTHVVARPPGWTDHPAGPPPRHEREP